MDLLLDLALIFVLRLTDVGIGTVRIVLLGRGSRARAAALGFVEAFIWVVAAARVLDGLEDPVRMAAFAAGFAAGTYVGATVEQWIAFGQSLVRIVAPVHSPAVGGRLREEGFGATVLNGDGMEGEVRVTFCVVPRRQVPRVLHLIATHNPQAFVTVDQTRSVDVSPRHQSGVRK